MGCYLFFLPLTSVVVPLMASSYLHTGILLSLKFFVLIISLGNIFLNSTLSLLYSFLAHVYLALSVLFLCPLGLLCLSSRDSLILFFNLPSLLLLSPLSLLCLSILASLVLIVCFLSFLPSGTLVWLGVNTADSCCSGNIPREIASNLNKLPKDASHSIFPLTDFAISLFGTTKNTLSKPLLIPRIIASCIFLDEN